MISVYVRKVEGFWFGLAFTGEKIVATSANSSREGTLTSLFSCLPEKVDYQVVEKATEFTEDMMLSLKDVHLGRREFTDFVLADEYYSAPVARVLRAAAAIPVGYVTSYGSIAKAAGTAAQGVGQIMARNPLYPIVPCHRVVGTDFSLVGFGGKRSSKALKAKLARLVHECRGTQPKKIEVLQSELLINPVEYVIKKADKQGLEVNEKDQKTLLNY
jgi:O-6-methylguanine DNA methyltransferase